MAAVYATPADVEEDLGANLYRAITDRDGDGSVDEAAVTSALTKAGALIDGYISRKLPASGVLPVVPPWLKQAAIDLAVYDLLETPSESEREKRDEALRLLRDVAGGRLELGVPLAESQLESDIVVDAADQVMGRASLGRIL